MGGATTEQRDRAQVEGARGLWQEGSSRRNAEAVLTQTFFFFFFIVKLGKQKVARVNP